MEKNNLDIVSLDVAFEMSKDKDGNIIEQNLKEVNTAYNEMGKMSIEHYYKRFYNRELHKIVPKNYIPIILFLEVRTLYIPVDLFLFDVWGYQVFYDIGEKNFDDKECKIRIGYGDILKVRVNADLLAEVKCHIIQEIGLEIRGITYFNNKEPEAKITLNAARFSCAIHNKNSPVSLKILEKDKKNISKYDITQIIHPNTKKSILHYDFRYRKDKLFSKEGNECIDDFLTVEDFIKYCKKQGIKIVRRTIEKYSAKEMFPLPYKMKKNNKLVNVYHKDWIIYLKEIEEQRKTKKTHLDKIKKKNPTLFNGIKNTSFFLNRSEDKTP